MITIPEPEFHEMFDIELNHLNVYAMFGGNMFEAKGEDLAYIEALLRNPDQRGRVWTIVADNGLMYYRSGFHPELDRFGYLVTAQSIYEHFDDDDEVIVIMEEDL